MLRYMPPKSSIWGHRLQRLSAAEARERLARFLDLAAASHHVGWSRPGTSELGAAASLALVSPQGVNQEAAFEELLGERAQNNRFAALDTAQFERCLDHLIGLERNSPSIASAVLLSQLVEVSAWRIADRSVPTLSRLLMYYGQTRCLSTTLQFDTVEDFHSIAAAFAESGLCKLNEKHLKKNRSR